MSGGRGEGGQNAVAVAGIEGEDGEEGGVAGEYAEVPVDGFGVVRGDRESMCLDDTLEIGSWVGGQKILHVDEILVLAWLHPWARRGSTVARERRGVAGSRGVAGGVAGCVAGCVAGSLCPAFL